MLTASSGKVEAGKVEAGKVEAGKVEAGKSRVVRTSRAPIRDCADFARPWDRFTPPGWVYTAGMGLHRRDRDAAPSTFDLATVRPRGSHQHAAEALRPSERIHQRSSADDDDRRQDRPLMSRLHQVVP